MQVAKQFVKDMRAYHSEQSAIKRDEIASHQLHALREYQGPREKKASHSRVKRCLQMKDHSRGSAGRSGHLRRMRSFAKKR
jgi:hypothetical protein